MLSLLFSGVVEGLVCLLVIYDCCFGIVFVVFVYFVRCLFVPFVIVFWRFYFVVRSVHLEGLLY